MDSAIGFPKTLLLHRDYFYPMDSAIQLLNNWDLGSTSEQPPLVRVPATGNVLLSRTCRMDRQLAPKPSFPTSVG